MGKKNGYGMCIADSLCNTPENNNIVNQLYTPINLAYMHIFKNLKMIQMNLYANEWYRNRSTDIEIKFMVTKAERWVN